MPGHVRALRPEDVEAATRVQIAAFAELDAAQGRDVPPVEELLPVATRRVAHLQGTDPDGAFVAEEEGRVVGVALALRREDVWFLSLLTVDPAAQSRGTGAALLDAALGYAEGTRAQYLCSSGDPRALRVYGRAGFALHPGLESWGGRVDRSLLPAVEGVREGDWERDGERLDALGRRTRGAGYAPDHAVLSRYRLLVAERGVVVVRPGTPGLLLAEDEETATRLLWAALAELGEDEVEVEPVLASEQWAVQVLLAAGLPLRPGGGMAFRGTAPPRLHLPSGSYG